MIQKIIAVVSLVNLHSLSFHIRMRIFNTENEVEGVSMLLSYHFWFALINNYQMQIYFYDIEFPSSVMNGIHLVS